MFRVRPIFTLNKVFWYWKKYSIFLKFEVVIPMINYSFDINLRTGTGYLCFTIYTDTFIVPDSENSLI